MDADQKRAMRIDVRRRRQREDTRSIKRRLSQRDWDSDEDEDDENDVKYNDRRVANQYHNTR